MRSVLPSLAALCALFAWDALLFRTPIYPSILEPSSSTGLFELTLRRELQYQAQRGDNLIVTLGDSRFAYLPRIANQFAADHGYMFGNAGVAGGDARCYYYMLRDLDPRANRYRAVMLAVNDYDDEDITENNADDLRDLHFLIARLRFADAAGFALSFTSAAHRWEVVRGSIWKGFVYQRDFQAFLEHPAKRLADVDLIRGGWAEWTYNYEEDPSTLAGLEIDWDAWQVRFPPSATEVQKATVRGFLMHPAAPQTGLLAAYRREWYGRILDRYRGSRTKVIFVRLPRGPVARPDNLVKKLSSSIREFAARPGVILMDEHAFESLERPDLFKDGLHLNREGAARFSAMLAAETKRILGPAN